MDNTEENLRHKDGQDAFHPNNPYDKLYKELFSDKKSFVSLLRDCIKSPWINELDENSLKKTSTSFILQDFSELEADIVYEARLKGCPIVFYVLLELQSKIDFSMIYRLFLYMVEILRYYYNHSEPDERDNKDFRLPVVFPILFYSGSGTWTVPVNFKDMFANADKFGSHVLNFEYALVNAKGYTKEELKKLASRILATALLLMKSGNDIEFLNGIRESLDDIEKFNDEERRLLNNFIRILEVSYGKGKEVKELIRKNKIQEADKMLCDMIENAKLEKEELMAKGEARGEAKGEAKGELKKALEVAKTLLDENLPIELIIKATKLSRKQIEELGV